MDFNMESCSNSEEMKAQETWRNPEIPNMGDAEMEEHYAQALLAAQRVTREQTKKELEERKLKAKTLPLVNIVLDQRYKFVYNAITTEISKRKINSRYCKFKVPAGSKFTLHKANANVNIISEYGTFWIENSSRYTALQAPDIGAILQTRPTVGGVILRIWRPDVSPEEYYREIYDTVDNVWRTKEAISANIQEVPNISAQDQIKNDLAVYFQEQGITDISEGVIKLSELLTNSMITENKLEHAPVIVKAWTALQIQKGTDERYYNSPSLGEFIYNSKVYSIIDYRRITTYTPINKDSENNDALVYNVKSGIRPYIPVGLKSTRYMFSDMELPANFRLEKDFNTSEIEDMSYMFNSTKANILDLGPTFITAKVENMCGMFNHTDITNSLNLGDNFTTEQVTDMSYMFSRVSLPKNFHLGMKFVTTNVKTMNSMFAYADLPKDFYLGELFDTRNCEDMSKMFNEVKFPANFRFNKLFVINTNKIESMFEDSYITKNMFEDCNFKIDCKEEDIDRIFNHVHCKSPEYLQAISKQFNFIDYEHQDYMDTNNYPELQEIKDLWYKLQKQQKDEGSCILGAYLTFHYKRHKFFWYPPHAHQGELSWTIPLHDTIIPKLVELGCTCIHYEQGHMD